ncbi:MAG: hypothetical protein KME29_04230 [Calothrix sp. FI2-JRJ7]|nr:hypothetical protein [Calothrix sp. FI2-JRJ7]
MYSAQAHFQTALAKTQPERVLYLAVPIDTYQTFFQLEFTQMAIQQYQLLLIVYNSANEEIVQWIK